MRRHQVEVGEIRVVLEGADADAGRRVGQAVERALRNAEIGSDAASVDQLHVSLADGPNRGDLGRRITRAIEKRLA